MFPCRQVDRDFPTKKNDPKFKDDSNFQEYYNQVQKDFDTLEKEKKNEVLGYEKRFANPTEMDYDLARTKIEEVQSLHKNHRGCIVHPVIDDSLVTITKGKNATAAAEFAKNEREIQVRNLYKYFDFSELKRIREEFPDKLNGTPTDKARTLLDDKIQAEKNAMDFSWIAAAG